jgi:cobalt-zinc-cadmium resistance protein CzcA
VDFGIIVETAVFGAEALAVSLARQKRKDDEANALALSEVLGPALLCAFLLLIAFIPILSLQRIEGRIFRPLGITLVSALVGGQLGAFIFLPLAASWAPIGPKPTKADDVFHWILERCNRVMLWFNGFKHIGWIAGAIMAALLILINWGMGTEFLPTMNEGNLWIRVSAPPTISREKAVQLAHDIRERMLRVKEVKSVVSQLGRPDDGSDISGFDTLEFQVDLGDPEDWKSADSIEGFVKLIREQEKDIEGCDFYYSQYIKDNVDEAITGVMGELAVKIHGPDLRVLQSLGDQFETIIAKTPGAVDVGEEDILQQPELQYVMDRDKMDSYGIQVSQAEDVLSSALSGKWAAQMVDPQGRYVDIMVKPRLPSPLNQNVLNSIPLLAPGGAEIPLGEVTQAKVVEGISHIYREEGDRRVAAKCSVRGRAVVEFVKECDDQIKKQVKLPPKYWYYWSGTFENAIRASRQLSIIVPICILAMITIMYTWFKDWRLLAILLWEIPFATLGGLAALRMAGLNLSISAAAGGIIRIGVSFLTGMMIISAFVKTRDASKALMEKGRSILISNGVAIIGLLPAALSHAIGSETARPFAVAILGGLAASMTLSLTLLPVFLKRIEHFYKHK